MLSRAEFLGRAGVAAGLVGVAVFAGMRLASAVPGGPTRDELTFSGVLRGADGGAATSPTRLRFVFRRPATPDCEALTAMFTPSAGGAFSVAVPLAACPRVFDGEDVTYDVFEGAEALATNVAVTPVPYARFADQVGVRSACPAGYTLSTDSNDAQFTVCRRAIDETVSGRGGFDEVVRVGAGAGAFWIDRYEASVWSSARGEGAPMFQSPGPVPRFPPNGNWRDTGPNATPDPAPTPPAWALSRAGVIPARFITWFQALEACAASGKTLPTRAQWLLAAQGANDPGVPAMQGCNTQGSGPREAGAGPICRSGWGAQDLIGNLWEWTDEWYSGLSVSEAARSETTTPQGWPAGFNNDVVFNVGVQVANVGGAGFNGAVPAAAVRGGGWSNGDGAGRFALGLLYGPSSAFLAVGFRCVVPR